MPKHTNILKCSLKNYWDWKGKVKAFMLAEDLMDTVDPNIPVPTGIVQFCQWTAKNSKAYGLLYLVLDQDVKTKIDNTNVQRSGCLLWAQFAVFFTTLDAANCSTFMAHFNEITHNLQQPVDQFLQAVVATEHNLTSIAVSLPLVHGLQQNSGHVLTPRNLPNMITVINNWESSDLQKSDLAVCAAHLAACPTASLPVPNHGGDYSVDPDTPADCPSAS
ncbi:hypothetical protein DFH08DRAFT_967347 [Mycena albidolilacea]|uniref:Uncharacterized protein n=1 Tax=Mycena albidolilacea TaxID=1033008 RepID=A0AAD6ZMR7_9AGAR|nr:hypothetical protein DFH08DRAFT_967347 [Mycena albidolilacea]